MRAIRKSKVAWALAIVAVLALQALAWAVHLEVKNGNTWLEGQGDGNGYLMVGGIRNVVLLPSAARTTSTFSAVQTNNNYRGVIIYLNISAASGTGGLTVFLAYYDPVSGQHMLQLIGSARTTVSLYACTLYPAAGLQALSGGSATACLPSQWSVYIQAGDNTSYTYSVSADLLI